MSSPDEERARPRCYVASPLGFTEGGRHYYARVLLPALAAVVEPIDPWSNVTEPQIAAAAARGRMRELWLAVGRRNTHAIVEADLLVAYLEGQEIDAGTAAEVGYAAGRGVRCHGLRSDLRQAGEASMTINLQVEAFILQSGGSVHPTLESLLAALKAHVSAARSRSRPA